MARYPVTNFGRSTLASGIASGATSCSVAAGDGARFPAPASAGSFLATIWNQTDYAEASLDPDREIVLVTARSTDDFTITRAQESTVDGNHNTGGKTYGIALTMTKGVYDALYKEDGTDVPVTDGGTGASTAIGAVRNLLGVTQWTDAATVTPDSDATLFGFLATVSQDTTLANPTGTPSNGQPLTMRIKSSAVRTWTWGANYRGSNDKALPTGSAGSSLTEYYKFIYNSADTKWDLVSVIVGF